MYGIYYKYKSFDRLTFKTTTIVIEPRGVGAVDGGGGGGG